MLHRLTRFDRPRTAAGTPLKGLYDAAAIGWQDGIAKLGFLDAYAHLMQKAAPPPDGARVFDAGTGTGAFAAAWVHRFGPPAALTLLDFSPVMLAAAAARLPATRTIAGPLEQTPADLPPQDVVLCAHLIEHLDDAGAALRILRERLKPGGQLVLALSRPHWCTALVRWRWGNAAFTPQEATAMLRRAGFTGIAVHRFREGPPSRVSCGYTARRSD